MSFQSTPASHVNFGIYTYKKERNLSGVTQVNHKSKLPYITKGCLFNDTSFYHPSCERACACSHIKTRLWDCQLYFKNFQKITSPLYES